MLSGIDGGERADEGSDERSMGDKMSKDEALKRGNSPNQFGVIPGALYAQRPARDRKGPRRHEAPDQWLDREVQGLFVTWKSDGENGRYRYASRQIADVAHGIRHPHRVLARAMRAAVKKKVAPERIRRLGELFIEYADRLERGELRSIA